MEKKQFENKTNGTDVPGSYWPYSNYRSKDVGCAGCMYDELTGLPSFNLFEDRLQTALTGEQVKDVRIKRQKIAVVGVYIANLSSFEQAKIREATLRQVAAGLLDVLPKNYTIARGINYHFWIMMPNMSNWEDIEIEIDKIKALMGRPIIDGVDEYGLFYDIGISYFDKEPTMATTLIGQAIAALQRAVSRGSNKVIYFTEVAEP